MCPQHFWLYFWGYLLTGFYAFPCGGVRLRIILQLILIKYFIQARISLCDAVQTKVTLDS